MVSISGCDPLDPGSNPGTAITFFCISSVAAVLFADPYSEPANEEQRTSSWIRTGLRSCLL